MTPLSVKTQQQRMKMKSIKSKNSYSNSDYLGIKTCIGDELCYPSSFPELNQ